MKYIDLDNSIKSAKNILIVPHVNPDGDCLGSMCALYGIIKKNYKKKCDIVTFSKIPSCYSFLPFINEVKNINEIDKSMVYDVVILVDVAALDRICDAKILFDKAKLKINIDHHKTNNGYGDMTFVESNASSAGEVVYNLLKAQDWKIDTEIAQCLYVAILTDTGGFKFENTSAYSLQIASHLVEEGVNPLEMYKKCYESKSKGLVLFQAYCVSKANFLEHDKIVYTLIYKKDLEKFDAKDDYTDGIAETLRSITSTDVSFVIKESEEGRLCKVSMRSKKLDVSKVCEKFNGGGHSLAAGCTIKASIEEAAKKILKEIYNQGI